MSTVLVNEKKERQRQKCANCHREEHANLRAGSSDGQQRLPSKQNVAGSSPAQRTNVRDKYFEASLAQLIEHLTCNEGVVGLNPTAGSKTNR